MTEEQLIDLGLKIEYIEYLKNTVLQTEPINKDSYEGSREKNKILVPVSKIVGLGMREEAGYSWWHHYIGSIGDLALNRLIELEQNFKKMGLIKFMQSFIDEKYCDQVDFIYYVDHDIYFAINGQHRTVMAKLVDAPYILAEVLNLEINSEKQKQNEKKGMIIEEVNTLLSILDLNISGRGAYWKDVLVIPLRLKFNLNISSIEDIIVVKKSLKLFIDSVIEVEDFQAKLTRSLRYQFKICFLRMLGKNYRVNRFEKNILHLKKLGWHHKIGR